MKPGRFLIDIIGCNDLLILPYISPSFCNYFEIVTEGNNPWDVFCIGCETILGTHSASRAELSGAVANASAAAHVCSWRKEGY